MLIQIPTAEILETALLRDRSHLDPTALHRTIAALIRTRTPTPSRKASPKTQSAKTFPRGSAGKALWSGQHSDPLKGYWRNCA